MSSDATIAGATQASFSPTFSPLYQQIKALITQSLEVGEWKPGDMIPSEIELAARYKVSQGTVRKAIDELAAGNLLLRRQGKGTFVATHTEPRAQFRFLRLMPDEGEQGYPESTILECRRVRAPAEIARTLELKPGDPVVTLRRLLSFSGCPCVLDELWLPGSLFKGLTAERLTESKAPLYSMFESEFGIKPTPRLQESCGSSRARRCCWSSASRSPTASGLSRSAGGSISPRATITRTN